MSTAPSRHVFVADTDPNVRSQVASALESEGWEVTQTDSTDDLVGATCQAFLIDPSMIEGDPATFLRSVRGNSGACVILLVHGDDELDWDEYTSAGVDDFFEVSTRPQMLIHRLRRWMPTSEEASGEGPGSWMDADLFSAKLADRLVSASGDESKLAVLAAVIETPGHDISDLSSSAERTWLDRIARRMQGAFEDNGDGGPLARLLAGMRLTRTAPDVVVMMIPGVSRLQDTAKIGARLQEQLAKSIELEGMTLHQQVGLGVAAFPEDGREATSLMSHAIEAGRKARREGSSLMVFHTEAMGRWAFERLTLERSLREAIAREELRVYYQPRVDAETRRIKGMECLVRWQHPELGLVPPGQFIPLAEETGLIVPIGEWVLREACRQNKAWRDAGLPEVAVSVNLSPVQFRLENLYEVVLDALDSVGLPPDALELEVTESMLMNDPKKTTETLERLKGAGIHISIDDFGTGYSSLSYLKRFPIDALKIDRSFVMNVTNDPDDAAIATAIILMGHSLKLSVVAEGVETESQLEFLRVLQCNEIQGYLFSPPVPADQAEQLLLGGFSSGSLAA